MCRDAIGLSGVSALCVGRTAETAVWACVVDMLVAILTLVQRLPMGLIIE